MCIHLHEVARVVKFTGTESRMVVLGCRGGSGAGELLFEGFRVAVWVDGKSSGNGSWRWLPNNVNALTARNCTLKIVKMATFMVCLFHHRQQ